MKAITRMLKEIELLKQELRNCVNLGYAIDEHEHLFGSEKVSAQEYLVNEENRLIKEIDKLEQKLLGLGYYKIENEGTIF